MSFSAPSVDEPVEMEAATMSSLAWRGAAPANGVAAADFSPAEHLALAPFVFPPPRPIGRTLPRSDPASALRDAAPLGRATVLREVGRASPLLAGVLRYNFALQPLAERNQAAAAAVILPAVGLWVATWQLAWPQAGTRNLAVAVAGYAVLCIVGGISAMLAINSSAKVAAETPQDGLVRHPASGLVRYLQMVRAGPPAGASEEPGGTQRLWLAAHDPADKLACPCPLPGCSGGLPMRAAYYRIFEYSIMICFLLTQFFFQQFTALAIYSHDFWPNPWMAVCGVLYLLAVVLFALATHSGLTSGNAQTVRLDLRLQARAVRIVLRQLVSRFDPGAPKCAADPADPGFLAAVDALVALRSRLASSWQDRLSHLSVGRPELFALFASYLAASVVNAAGAGCLPLGHILGMLHVTVIFVADLFFVAASNAEIAALSALFRQASIEVREASLRSGAGTAREVEGLLLAYADGRQYQSRFVGYVVSADVARTAVVTFVTVAVAAYTILRGTGLYVSPGNVCGT